jgi:ribosome-binding protein aMBF1 (putative translation factor)
MTQSTEIKSEALGYLYEKYYKDHPERLASLEREMVNVAVAERLYDLRTQLELSQEELAGRVGIDVSVIEDLEEADFEGDALLMLTRIAGAIGKKVILEWLEAESEAMPSRIEVHNPLNVMLT